MGNNLTPSWLNGPGMWIWQIDQCLGGSIQAIITKLKDNNIKYVLIKCGDGINTWDQWTQGLVDAFKNSGVVLGSWSFVYGDDPQREAAIAEWALDMGSAIHVFDVEGQYEGKPQSAVTMLQAVRAHAPNALLAYSTFPIIDFHQSLPYLEFGKYCNFAMPQVYWNDFQKTPAASMTWMQQVWNRWHEVWKNGGHADSVKPIIPTGSAYDITSNSINYVCTPKDLTEFFTAAKEYGSANLWSMQHIVRFDLWDAIKNFSPNFIESPASPTDNLASTNTPKQEQPAPSTPVTPATAPLQGTEEKPETPNETKTETPAPAEKTPTVTVSPTPQNPSTISINLATKPPVGEGYHKPHIEYVIDFFTWVNKLFTRKQVKKNV